MRQDWKLAAVAGLAAFGTAGGALALYGVGVPFAAGAALLAGCAGLVVRAFLPPPPPDLAPRLAEVETAASALRHDLRGALSPALMVTDRLTAHADPAIRRAGEAVLKSITRASAMIDVSKV